MQTRAVPRLLVVVSIESPPQPYFRLERQAVEETELFTARRQIPVPEHIANLGITPTGSPNWTR